jgi:ribonuclease HII
VQSVFQKRPAARRLPHNEKKRLFKLLTHERAIRAKGYQRVAGVDEAGRGPLAGPVVAAACILEEGALFSGVNDSKVLTPQKRAELYEALIKSCEVAYGVGIIEPALIDEINIHQATLLAMKRALSSLPSPPDYVLVDGLKLNLSDVFCERIVNGDALVYCICAASIIAKETRDRIMRDYHLQYPHYGFDAHKGYATPQHLAALSLHGPCPLHRRSFGRIKEED